MAGKGKRKSGSRLNRSKTVTVRLNPKLHYLAELAARQQRRTLSSFIEWAIEESLPSVTIEERWHLATRTADKRVTVADIARDVWEVDEIDRFFKLALRYPHLLTHEEQVLWKLIRENAYLWYGFGNMAAPATVALSDLSAVADLLRPHWEAFKQVAAGEADESILPQEPSDDLLDDDEFTH
jgi:predicted transcriptional regulator